MHIPDEQIVKADIRIMKIKVVWVDIIITAEDIRLTCIARTVVLI